MADETTERIVLLLQARDRDLSRALDRVDKKLAKFEKNATKSVSGATRKINQDLGRIGASLRGFAAGALATAFGAAVAGVTTGSARAVRSIAEIGDEAKRSGLGIEAFQELRFVAQQARIPVDALVDGMKELNLRADEFVATGKGSAAEAFARLGMDPADVREKLKDPKELMLEIVDVLEDMDRAAQIRIADEIFGGTGGERFVELIAQGDEGIRQLIDRAHEVGAVLDQELIAKADQIDRRYSELAAQIGAHFKEAVIATVGAVQDLDRALTWKVEGLGQENLERELTDTFDAVVRQIQSLTGPGGLRLMDVADVDIAHDLAAILGDIEREMQAFQSGQTGAESFTGAVSDSVTEAQALLSELDDIDAARFGGVISGINGLAGALSVAAKAAENLRARMVFEGVDYGPRNGRPNNRPTDQGTDLAPTTSPRPRAAPPDLGGDASFGGGGGGGGGARQSDFEREAQRIRERTAALELEAAELIAVAAAGRDMGQAIEFARKKAELLHAAQRSGRAITPELRDQVDALAASYVSAGQNAEDAADRIDRINRNAERGIDTAVDLFMAIQDGADGAKRALAGLLLEMANVQLRNGLMGAASLGGGGGEGGIFAFLGSLLGRRSMGGPVKAGVPYLVNENTTNSEVWVPPQSGTVLSVPQAQAAVRGNAAVAAGAGGTTTIRLLVPEGVTAEDVDARAAGIAVEIVQENNRQLVQARRRS